MVINILNICNSIMKSLKTFDSSTLSHAHIEENIAKNLITTNPNIENPDIKDITYHKAGEGKYVYIKDPEVRRILATLIPTYDGIGFTMQDILSVTSFGNAFKYSTIKTFNEFKYFTNIGSITNAFTGSTLEEISMPPITINYDKTKNSSDKSPFYNCLSLKRVHWGSASLAVSSKECTVENRSNNNIATQTLYRNCISLETFYPSTLFPSNVGETMGQIFEKNQNIKKFIYPNSIRYIYRNAIANTPNIEVYMELPSALEVLNVFQFTRDSDNSIFHIVVKNVNPPTLENYDNLSYQGSGAVVNFYIIDNFYNRFMSNNEWRTLNGDSHFNICKLSTLPKKYYTYGAIRTNPDLMDCFIKKYNMLDILYADSSGNLEVTDQTHQLDVSTGYKPIAICIAGTGFFGDGELARWVALRAAYAGTPSANVIDQNFTPGTGSNSLYDTERIYSGDPSSIGSTNQDIGIFNKFCRFSTSGSLEPVEGFANYGSDQTNTPTSMPMLTPDNKLNNILLGANDKYRMTSCQGIMYTQIVTTQFETYQTTWQTDSVIDNTVQSGHFPIFLAASRYYTNGTHSGDWYVGASGEVMMLSYQYIVNDLAIIIQQLDTKYGLNAIDANYTTGAHICSDLYDKGSGVYGFNRVTMSSIGLPKNGIIDTLTRCQPIMQY